MKDISTYIDIFKLRPVEITDVPESFSSEVYRIQLMTGEKVILKIPYSKAKFERELKMLNLLKDRLPVPNVLESWEGDDVTPCAFLLSYIDGLPVMDSVDEALAYQMGELLAQLHTVPMAHFSLVNAESDHWWSEMREIFQIWIKECEPVLDSRTIEKCNEKFESFFRDLPDPDGPCVIHMDFRPGNILVKDNKVKGLIDFESAKGGSADLDFTKIKLYVWDKFPGTKEAFIDGYRSIRPLPKIEKTLPLYLFYQAVGGIAWSVRRGQLEGNFFKESMEQLKEFIAI